MNKAYDRLKRKWEEDPLQVLIVAALVATAAAKLMQARNETMSRKIWEMEVRRRTMK